VRHADREGQQPGERQRYRLAPALARRGRRAARPGGELALAPRARLRLLDEHAGAAFGVGHEPLFLLGLLRALLGFSPAPLLLLLETLPLALLALAQLRFFPRLALRRFALAHLPLLALLALGVLLRAPFLGLARARRGRFLLLAGRFFVRLLLLLLARGEGLEVGE
jgi:hypothetical protein